MADNVGYTPGTGATVAADEIGGVLHQRVKIGVGADGSATDVSDANPMPIAAYGELIEAIEAMRMAIQSLNRTVGLAQVNPTTGRMFVDGSGVTQPISGSVTVSGNLTTVSTVTSLTNLTQLGGQNANSVPVSLERTTADNLRRNINVT
jgi:hypothetical protein